MEPYLANIHPRCQDMLTAVKCATNIHQLLEHAQNFSILEEQGVLDLRVLCKVKQLNQVKLGQLLP